MQPERPERQLMPPRWAPWWIYLVIILGANYVRRAVVGDGGPPAVGVVVALAIAVALFTIITLAYRANVRRDRTDAMAPPMQSRDEDPDRAANDSVGSGRG